MHPTEMMYENTSAALETDRTAVKAAVEPKLMAARMRDTPRHSSNLTLISTAGILLEFVRLNGTHGIDWNLPSQTNPANPY